MGVELFTEWDVTQKTGVTMGPQQQKKLKYVGI